MGYLKLPVASGGSGAADAKKLRLEIFESISAATGTVTKPTGSIIRLNEYGAGADAVLAKISSSYPIPQNVVDVSGNILSTTFNTDGDYVLSGTPTAYPIAICYVIEIAIEDYDDSAANIISVRPAGLSALSLADGSVSDTEFKYINTLTSNVQDQLNNKERLRGDLYNRVFIDLFSTTDGGIGQQTSGGSISMQATGANGTENTNGVLRMTTAATNDRSGFSFGQIAWYLGSGGAFDFSISLRMCFTTNLPDVTDNNKFLFGISDSLSGNGTSDVANGVYFRYDSQVNGGKFECVNRTTNADTEALDSTYTPTVNVFDVLKLNIDQTGVAKFYINGVLKQTSTTTLSCPAALMGIFIKFLKTAGSGTRLASADYLDIEYSRTSAR